jgi:ADP-ribose pyrophosphatase
MSSSGPPPWLRLELVRELDFGILKVREHRVQNPRNATEHLRVTLDTSDYVNVVAITPHAELILVRQFRAGVWSETLELPSGLVEPGEAGLAAGLRELREETGYSPTQSRVMGAFHPNPALQGNLCHAVLAEGCTLQNATDPDPGEDLRTELLPIREVDRAIGSGRISHALAIATLFFWRHISGGL